MRTLDPHSDPIDTIFFGHGPCVLGEGAKNFGTTSDFMSLNMPLVVIETAGALSNIQVLFCDQVGGLSQVMVPSIQVGIEEFTRRVTGIAN